MIGVLALLSAEIILSNNAEMEIGHSNERVHLTSTQRLPFVITDSCIAESMLRNATIPNDLSNATLQYNENEVVLPVVNPLIPTAHSPIPPEQRQGGSKTTLYGELLSLSHIWYPGIGCALTVFLGLLFSIPVIKFQKKLSVCPECFSPVILKLWLKWFPSHMSIWVEPDENLVLLSSSVFSFLVNEPFLIWHSIMAGHGGLSPSHSVPNFHSPPFLAQTLGENGFKTRAELWHWNYSSLLNPLSIFPQSFS